MVHPRNGVLFSLKERILTPAATAVQLNRTVTEGQILQGPTYVRSLEKSKTSRRQTVERWVPGEGEGAGALVFDRDRAPVL